MEEENKKQVSDNETSKSKKELFMERFSSSYPDVSSDDEDSFYGKMNDEFDRFGKMESNQKELADLLARDPRSAGFLMVMKNGGNPMEYLIEQYGDDFKDALSDESKAKELTKAFSKYTERQLKENEIKQRAEGNLQKMIDELDAAQEEGSFTDEDATKAYEYLYADGGLLDRIITNEIHKDDWIMLMKAAKYDEMVAQARNEGEIRGRNANIDIQKRKRSTAAQMPSNIPSSGKEIQKPKKDAFLDMLDRRKSVWDD